MEAARNPYGPPASSWSTEPKEQSGLGWLLTGMAVFLACSLVSGYFLLAEIPCVMAEFDQRNAQLPKDLLAVNRADPLKYWFIFVLAVLLMLLLTEWRFTSGTKRRVRRWIGGGVGITSMAFTFWLTWATLSG